MRDPVVSKGLAPTRILAIDSGFATLGIAVVEGRPERALETARLIDLRFLATKKADKKARRAIRVCTDDMLRIRHLTDTVAEMIECYQPQALAVEWFQPNPRQGGFASGGWKAAITVGGLITLGRERQIAVLEQLPSDVKRLVGSQSASKQDVTDWLTSHLPGFREAISRIAASHQEHPSDAAGHALVGLRELHERRQAAGL